MGFLKDKINAATAPAPQPPVAVEPPPARPAEPPMPSRQRFLHHPDAEAFFGAVFAGAPDEAHTIFNRQESWEDKSFCVSTMSLMPGRRNRLDEWVSQRPADTLGRICRGAHGIAWAWNARSSARADEVTAAQFEEFFHRLNIAEADLIEAVMLDPTNPLGWEHLITTARGLQIPREEADYRMSKMLGIAPLLGGHLEYLQYICEKWSGSHDDMVEFAMSVIEAIPDGSPLSAVAPIAALERTLLEDTIDPAGDLKATPLHKLLIESAKKSVLHPQFLYETPQAAIAMNCYITAFDRYGLQHLAVPLLERIGDRYTEFPMVYYWGEGDSAWDQLKHSITSKAPGAQANSFESAF